MKIFNKSLIIITLVLIVSVIYSFNTDANISKKSFDNIISKRNLKISGLDNDSVHYFCFIESGNVRHKNFKGWFPSIFPTNHPKYGFCHFGIGSFELVLQRDYFTGYNEITLQISRILKKDYYDNYIRLKVDLFVGFYQPTGGLGDGTLSGFALKIKILYKGDIPIY